MSSHHVIRENQEPALIIQNFNALDLESLGQLLEWSPTLVTNEDSLDNLLSEGIKVDVLFSNKVISDIQEHTKVVPLEGDFLAASLHYLKQHNHQAVNIITDNIPAGISSFAKDSNIVLFYQNKRFVFVHTAFEKWKPKGEYLYIDESLLKSFQGLDYRGEGTFITCNDGFIQLEFNSADFVLLGEDL